MNITLKILAVTISGVAAVILGSAVGESLNSDTKIEFTSGEYTYIGKVDNQKLVRINDLEKGVSCYILGGHRALSCVSTKP